MRIISNAECKSQHTNRDDIVTNSMLCAKGLRSNVCTGDSGYPAICRDEDAYQTSIHLPAAYRPSYDLLCGIVSWSGGDGDCEVDENGTLKSPRKPAVFTKVSYFSAWIYYNLQKLQLESYFLCDNLQYVKQSEVCDFNRDCSDGSDEFNCTIVVSSTPSIRTSVASSSISDDLSGLESFTFTTDAANGSWWTSTFTSTERSSNNTTYSNLII